MKRSYQLARLLAYVTGLVNQELLLQVEYLAVENRILRAHAPARLRLSNAEGATLGEIGKRLGRKALAKVAQVAGRRRFSAGGANWLLRSSMVQSTGRIRGGRRLALRQKS